MQIPNNINEWEAVELLGERGKERSFGGIERLSAPQIGLDKKRDTEIGQRIGKG